MKRLAMVLFACALAAPSLAFAQSVALEVSGPRARMVERELTDELSAAGITVEEGALTRVVAQVVRRGRRGWRTEVALRNGFGDEVVSSDVSHRTFEGMTRALGRWSTSTLAPAIRDLGASAPEASPAERPTPSSSAEPAPRQRTESTRTPEPTRDDAPPSARVPPFAFHGAIALTHRSFSYTDDIYATLRPYSLPIAPFLRLAVEWFPGAHFDAGAFGGFSVALHGNVALSVESVDGQGVVYPTEAWGLGLDLRYRIRVDDVTFGITAGYRTQTFAIRDADELSPRPAIPNVEYHSLRAGASFRWDLGLGVFLDVEGAYLQPLAAGEILSDAWFHRGEVGGFDGAAGVGLRVDDVQLAARFELQRFWYDMRSEPGDARVAGGALDEYFSGVLSLVYTPSGL